MDCILYRSIQYFNDLFLLVSDELPAETEDVPTFMLFQEGAMATRRPALR